MSDTGAGHRAAACAIRAALQIRYPHAYTFELVDVFRDYTPVPFKFLPEIYPRWVNWAKTTWGIGYRLADTRPLDRAVMAGFYHLWQTGMQRLIHDHPASVYVSVHALFSRPVMRALVETSAYRSPLVTVVTDLVSTHAFWYEKGIDRCLVPTQIAYDRGLKYGLCTDQMRITGQPIHPRFTQELIEKDESRRKLGWRLSPPVVLLVGGGDGMGPIYQIAEALNRRKLDMQLIIIAGHNRALRRRLERVRWNQITRIYPFVENMPELMAGADILITKAGPATIGEACLAGLPMVISGAIPGQEDGNITYVVESGAGVYAPGPQQVANTIAAWLNGESSMLDYRSRQAQRLAHAEAVWEIADEIHAQAQRAPIPTRLSALTRQKFPGFSPQP
ncbi:MAG: galactosyldiacylglycerol synthase [Chloroflexi bacterium]|nr:galactosyldiacylglycerol synthase [Chloroflexota bacterium]